MSAGYINEAIASLGKDLFSLTRTGTVPHAIEKNKAFPEDEYFHVKVIKGIELLFYEKTGCLEAVSITLGNMAPWSKIYVGGLPPPYKISMSFQWVRETFGNPYRSQGPEPMPKPMLYSGGWDEYRPSDLENIKINFLYSENMEVCGISFKLIDGGMNS